DRRFLRLVEAEGGFFVGVECGAFDRRLEEMIVGLDVGRDELAALAHVPRRRTAFARDALREQNTLENIQATIIPGLEIVREIILEQVMIHEGLVFFVTQIRLDDRSEESAILLRQEKAELMAGEFAVFRPLLIVAELRPV